MFVLPFGEATNAAKPQPTCHAGGLPKEDVNSCNMRIYALSLINCALNVAAFCAAFRFAKEPRPTLLGNIVGRASPANAGGRVCTEPKHKFLANMVGFKRRGTKYGNHQTTKYTKHPKTNHSTFSTTNYANQRE